MAKRKRHQVSRLLVTGEIGDALLTQLYAIPDTVRSIDLHVCSAGGSFFCAVAAIEILRRWQRQKKTVRTVALGECCSAATLIVAAGSPGYRYSYRSTLWGIHLPFIGGEQLEDWNCQKADGKLLKLMETQCMRLLWELTKTPQKQWKEMLTRTSMVWCDGEGAHALGLVDDVVPQ